MSMEKKIIRVEQANIKGKQVFLIDYATVDGKEQHSNSKIKELKNFVGNYFQGNLLFTKGKRK